MRFCASPCLGGKLYPALSFHTHQEPRRRKQIVAKDTQLNMGLIQSRSKEFGGSLSLAERAVRSGVQIPLVVDACILHLTTRFLRTQNLFTVPASRYLLQASRKSEKYILNDQEYVFRKKSIKLYIRFINAGRLNAVPFSLITDPYILSGLLKSYFSLLDPSLFTYFLYNNFIDAQKEKNALSYIVRMRSLVAALPRANKTLLVHMLKFFRNIISAGQRLEPVTASAANRKKKITQDRNSIDEVARAWGPILLRPPHSPRYSSAASSNNDVKNMVNNTKASIACLKNCLEHFDEIFNKSNEKEMERLVQENQFMGKKYRNHKLSIDNAQKNINLTKMLRYQYIIRVGDKERLRQLFKRWKENAEMVLGKRSIYDRIRIAENANAELQRKIKKLKEALEKASMHINVQKIHGIDKTIIMDVMEEKSLE